MAIPAAIDRLATVVSGPVARDLCLTGRIVGAGEAARLGLVDRLVEPGASVVAAVELAREIAASAGAGAMKRVFVGAQPDLFE